MVYRKITGCRKLTWCLLLTFLSLLVGFAHISRYPLLALSRDYLHDGHQHLLKVQAASHKANYTLLEGAQTYVDAIMNPKDKTFPRLECPRLPKGRYEHLRRVVSNSKDPKSPRPKYFFALDLHQNAALLPRLLGSVLETVRFLGPKNCALSIVEGRSDDSTYEILLLLELEMSRMGVPYFFNSSDINPLGGGDRVKLLADLRNQVLEPLTSYPNEYAEDATIIFLNDVSICMEDILELVHQKVKLDAHMTCAMDWTYVTPDDPPFFYDIWVSRTIKGDLFFNIPSDGSWSEAYDLFWDDLETRRRFQQHKPFQVFSCWNGATAFDSKPLVEQQLRFRGPFKDECYQGEPQLFCKDLWMLGYNKIAVVPSINLEYNDVGGKKLKKLKGYVSDWITTEADAGPPKIEWQADPPKKVKCMASFQNQTWNPWDEGLTGTQKDKESH